MNEMTSSPYHPIFEGVEIGVGARSWGDRLYWGYGRDYGEDDVRAAIETCLELGVTFFDTAEVYGQGKSEEILGSFSQKTDRKMIIASKFFPLPWRLGKKSLIRALEHSLRRLQITCLDLYQINYPIPPITIETWMDAMLAALQAGFIRAVGISNYNRQQTQRAYDHLIRQGVRLASNQVEYSLLNRTIEKNGVLDLCRDLGIRVIAHCPLGLGVLTGKYSPSNPPREMISRGLNRNTLREIQPLMNAMKRIGASHDGKTPAQVALNWIICKGVLPIPGAKNDLQARQNCDSAGWRLAEGEVKELDELSDRIRPTG